MLLSPGSMADKIPSTIILQGGTLLQHDDDDNVVVLDATDLMVKNATIVQIGKNLEAQPGTLVIDCHDAIVSPGFIDTHHHVWQTQLKGRHSDDTLLDYTAKGMLCYCLLSPHSSTLFRMFGC